MLRLRPYAPLALLTLTATIVPWLPAQKDKDKPAGLVVALRGHQEAVYGVAFTADGKMLLTASGDPGVKVWDLASGKAIKTFAGPGGHTGIILGIALSPDGSQFATVGADNTARLWDFPSSKPLRELAVKGQPRAVAATADGTRLAGGSSDGTIRIWNSADGKQLHELTGHTGAVAGLAFSPNGQLLASAGTDGTLRFWSVADGKALARFAAHAGAVTGLAYAPGNNAVYTTGTDGTLRYWTLPPAAPRAPQAAFKESVTSVSLSSDLVQLVAASGKGVRLVNYANGATTRDLGPTADAVTAAASSGTYVAAAAGRRLYLWQAKDGKVLSDAVAHPGAVTAVAFNPGGNQVATVGKDGWLRTWTVPRAPTRSIDAPGVVRAAVVTGDGKRIAIGGSDKAVRLYKIDAPQAAERQITSPSPVTGVAASADGKLLVSAGEDGAIRFWGPKGEESAAIGAHAEKVVRLELLGTTQALSASSDGTLKLWSVPTGKAPSYAHPAGVTAAALSPDGTKLLTASDKQARLWDLAKGQAAQTWAGPAQAITCVAYSGNGARVAVGAADRSLWAWEAAGKAVQKIANLPAVVQAIAFSADASRLLAALADGTVRSYDLKTAKETASFTGQKGPVNALALSPKGDQVYYAGAAGTIEVRGLDKKAESSIKHGGPVATLALSRDGTLLGAGGEKQVKLYRLPGGKLEATIAAGAEVRGIGFSPDGKKVAIAGADGKARVFTLTGQLEEHVSHDGAVHAALFSLDGKRLVTAGADKAVRSTALAFVWAANHAAAIRQAVLSPRGDRVYSAGADGMLRIWNKADGKLLQSVRAHEGNITALALSGDASRAVTAGADKVARVWELAKLPAKTGGKEMDRPLSAIALPGEALSLSLTANGSRLAVGLMVDKAEQVRLFDASTGKALGEVDGAPAAIVAYQPDNRTLLAAGDKRVRLLDSNLVTALEAHASGATGVAYHNNGTQALTAGLDRSAKLWSLATGKLERTFATKDAVSAVAFSRDFTQVAAVAGKALTIWTANDGKEVASITMPAEAAALSFSSDKGKIATAGKDGRARVWDVATKKEWQGFLHSGPVTGVVFHPFAQIVLTSGEDKTVGIHTLSLNRLVTLPSTASALAAAPNGVQVWAACGDSKARAYNSGNGNLDRTLEAGTKGAASVAVSRNGQLVAVGGGDGKVRAFGADGKLVAQITAPAVPAVLAFSPDSKALLGGGADGSLTAWDVIYQPGQAIPADFGKVAQAFRHAKPIEGLAFSGTTNVFASAAPDGTIKVWKLAAEAPTRTFTQPAPVNAVAYDPKGERLATGCSDGRLRIYNVAKGTLERDVLAHGKPPLTQSVYAVAFSPDGKHLATGGADHSLKLVEVTSGKIVRELKAHHAKDFPKGHRDSVLAVAFSPDGKQLASAGIDQTIKIWNVADGTVARELTHPKLKPDAKDDPQPAHPGWVYGLRWGKNGKLYSAGKAPSLRGYLACWDTATGKLLNGEELKVGSIFGLALSADEQFVALGTGGSLRTGPELNQGVVLKAPGK